MIEKPSETRMCFGCKMYTNRLLMSSLLIVLSWKFSTGTNGIAPGLESDAMTLSPALSNVYTTTHVLKIVPDDIPYASANTTFVLDALPMPITGCQDSWTTAHLSLSNRSSVGLLDISEAPHFSHSKQDGMHELHLCIWRTDGHRQRFTWTHDNYCFIVLLSISNEDGENICPDNFYRDTLFTEYHTFELSSPSSRVTMDRCCRLVNGTHTNNIPPNLSSPYYLLSANDGTCPNVEGSVTSSEILKLEEKESLALESVQLCYYEKEEEEEEEEVSWTLEDKLELSVYVIVLGTPTATLLVVCLCQIRTRSTKRKYASYRQSRFSSNHTQASVMFRQSSHHAPTDQPSSGSLNERRGCRASTRF